jgi:hypothetical protein
MRPSEAIAAIHEFFELHAGEGASLSPERCALFRDGLADVLGSVRQLENTAEQALRMIGEGDEPATSYHYQRAVEHQCNRDLVRSQSVSLDETVILFPNILRAEASARIAALGGGE